jgi:hypothetical protein
MYWNREWMSLSLAGRLSCPPPHDVLLRLPRCPRRALNNSGKLSGVEFKAKRHQQNGKKSTESANLGAILPRISHCRVYLTTNSSETTLLSWYSIRTTKNDKQYSTGLHGSTTLLSRVTSLVGGRPKPGNGF